MTAESRLIEFFGTAPSDVRSGAAFGCASHGAGGPGQWILPGNPLHVRWGAPLRSLAIGGTFAEARAWAAALPASPALFLVFSTGTPGIERFLADLAAIHPATPVSGGGAAWTPGRSLGQISPAGADVALLAVLEGRWSVETFNVLSPVRTCRVRRGGPRQLDALQIQSGGDFLPGLSAFAALQREFNKAPTDRESITFSDRHGRNIHCHEHDGHLCCGADLPEGDDELTLRVASPQAILDQLNDLSAAPDSLLIGCAGLRGVLPAAVTFARGAAAAFLFGEIVPIDSGPGLPRQARFGNLMVARIRRAPGS